MARVVSRIGQANGTGDANALFLKRFAGEVLTAFRRSTVTMNRHVVRSIDHGKSASFPATWKASASYHTPGNEITGGTILHNERVITIDDLLVAPLFLYELDEAKNHYSVRQEYSFQAGDVLAQTLDKNVLRLAYLAARDSATISGGNGGTVIEVPNAKTDADDLVAGLFDAAQALDEKDVPETDRYAFVTPAEYNLLVHSSSKAIHRDFGGSGSIAKGIITEVAGLELVKTNNLSNGLDIDSGPDKYQGDFTNSVVAVMHRSAVGTVKLLDISVEMDWEITYQGHIIVAKMAVGSGILRPEAAVEITTDEGEGNGGGD